MQRETHIEEHPVKMKTNIGGGGHQQLTVTYRSKGSCMEGIEKHFNPQKESTC